MIRHSVARSSAILAVMLLALGAYAQEEPGDQEPTAEREPEVPADAFGRGAPRSSVGGFLDAAESGDFTRAADYLDLRYLPPRHRGTDPQVLAEQLNLVLERALWIDVGALSNDSEGLTGDGLPPYRDEFARFTVDDRETILLLERVPRDDGELIWLVSSGTVARAVDVYDEFAYGPFVEALSEAMPDVSFLGVALFKWVIGLGTGLVAYGVLFLLMWLIARIISSPKSELYPKIRRFLRGPVAAMIAIAIGGALILELGVGQTGQRVAEAKTLTIVFSVWIAFSLLDLLAVIVARRLRAKGRPATVVLLRPLTTSIKIVVMLAAVLIWLDNIGFNITTLLAGLGIGGLAVALALQKPLEDLFGALTLFTQQAVRLGDFCRFGSKVGTVEEIGLRTTRIRTLEDTVVSLPNARFASEYIENVTARAQIRYHAMIRLRVDSSRPQIEEVLEKTRELFASHARAVPDSGRVRLKELGEYTLLIETHGYVATTDYVEYLEVAEEMNLGIVAIVAQAGAQFALPLERPERST